MSNIHRASGEKYWIEVVYVCTWSDIVSLWLMYRELNLLFYFSVDNIHIGNGYYKFIMGNTNIKKYNL